MRARRTNLTLPEVDRLELAAYDLLRDLIIRQGVEDVLAALAYWVMAIDGQPARPSRRPTEGRGVGNRRRGLS